jgi:hypothetical protein
MFLFTVLTTLFTFVVCRGVAMLIAIGRAKQAQSATPPIVYLNSLLDMLVCEI